MEQDQFIRYAAETFDRLGIRYFITGSVASSAYGHFRLTNDVDVVAAVRAEHIPGLLNAFPPDRFYISDDGIRDAIAHHSQFNVIDTDSFIKLDVMLPEMGAFDQARFSRARPAVEAAGMPVMLASPEDVILKKLVFYQEGQSVTEAS